MKKALKTLSRVCYTLMCTLLISCSDTTNEENIPTTLEPEPSTKDYQLQENVIQIEGNALKQINSVEDMTIIYNGNTTKEDLPQVGKIILVSQPSTIFPHGFLGKAIRVSEQGGRYHIETEPVALDEAFTYLNVSKSYELTPDEVTSTANNRGNETDYITFKRPFNKEISEGIDVNGELTLGVKIDIALNIDKRKGKNIRNGSIKTSILQQVEASLDIELEKEYEDNVNLTPKAITFPALQLGPITLVPALQPYLFIQAEGKIEAHPSMNYQQIRNTSLTFDGQSWKFDQDNASEPFIEFNLTPDIDMEGSIYDGIGTALEFRLYGSESNKAFIDAKLGPQISGEVTLVTTPDSLYESGKDSQLNFGMLLSAGGGAGVKFFSIEKEWSKYPINISFLESTRNFFPSFDKDKINRKEGIITASTELGCDLLWESEVGLALYDGDKCIQRSDSVVYQFEKKFKDENPLQVTFENIPKENNYSIWSYVKWGDMYVKCKRLNSKLLYARHTNGNDASSFEFTYNSDGLIERITIIETEADKNGNISFSYTEHYNFNYSDDKNSFSVRVSAPDTESSYTFDITLNENGFIKSCKQIFYDGDVDIWEYEYNEDNQMIKMYRTEGRETWHTTYNNEGDATEGGCNGESSNKIYYSDIENKSNAILHEIMYGTDIDEMEVFGLIGLLGKPSKHLPNKRIQNYSDGGETCIYNFSWDTDNHGFPTKVWYKDGGDLNTISFTWE